MNASEMREQIPVLGNKEYWYPALRASKVGKKPVGVKIMGEDIVFFQGDSGVAALANACPHRGGSLKHGDCHYKGTVACPYHGWVFNEEGECLAVLAEGPQSRIPEIAKARKYPTRTLRGMVFIWMGEGQPAALEDDIPPEFLDDSEEIMVFTVERQWPVNWRVALENALDSHVMYVHRNSVLLMMEPFLQFGKQGNRVRIVNDKACIGYMPEPPKPGREYYPRLKAWWPKVDFRKTWLWLFALRKHWLSYPPFNNNEEWDMHTIVDGKRIRAGGHHLPTMFRFDYGTHMYTRCCVPIDENNTRVIYYHSVRRKTALGRFLHRVYFTLVHNYLMHEDFSQQDYDVMAPQRYDLPETLSSTDAEVVAWRRLLLRARTGPGQKRDAGPRAVEVKAAAN
jgi:phenylpropionate dioxygenase-like ring-hydroxylating dioxygenase large terminal subunit